MNVFMGICLQNHIVEAKNGDRLELSRGKEYTISAPTDDGMVVVFSTFWTGVSAGLFGGVEPLGDKP